MTRSVLDPQVTGSSGTAPLSNLNVPFPVMRSFSHVTWARLCASIVVTLTCGYCAIIRFVRWSSFNVLCIASIVVIMLVVVAWYPM